MRELSCSVYAGTAFWGRGGGVCDVNVKLGMFINTLVILAGLEAGSLCCALLRRSSALIVRSGTFQEAGHEGTRVVPAKLPSPTEICK